MNNQRRYEWSYEIVDEHGDIMDSDFADRLSEFPKTSITNTLCLVINIGNELDGVVERDHAYVENGNLPECFPNLGIAVPKRFIKELHESN